MDESVPWMLDHIPCVWCLVAEAHWFGAGDLSCKVQAQYPHASIVDTCSLSERTAVAGALCVCGDSYVCLASARSNHVCMWVDDLAPLCMAAMPVR
jgi:hypothetical protein